MGNCGECISNNDSLVNIIAESKNFEFVVFSKPNCPDCIKARTLLFTSNKLPKIIELNKNHQRLKQALARTTQQEKPPYIFRNGEYLGGLHDLEKAIKKEGMKKE